MIYTITLNPAFDVHATADRFEAFHENLARVESRQAGGKGINISRALVQNGVSNAAIVVLGDQNAAEFKQELEQAGVTYLALERPGRIRENLTLHCPDMPETRISFTGFRVEDSVLDEVEQLLQLDKQTVVTFTGRIGDGMSVEAAKAFLLRLKQQGVKVVLDSRSFGNDDILQTQPWLIKPNQEEISQYLGRPVETMEDAVAAAKEFAAGGIENVMVSMGGQGAVLVSGGSVYLATPPRIEPVSTIGAGDSTVAGFVAATMAGADVAQTLRTAVAYGTAACLTEGSLPPEKAAVERISEQIDIREIN